MEEEEESPTESSPSVSLKMGRGEELSDFQRGTVVGCYLCKKPIREIAAMLDVPRSTVSSVVVKWKREGITSTLPRCGRPQKLREEHRQVLEKVALETCLPSVKAITAEFQAASGAQVSSRTVRRELHEMGFRGRVSTYRKSAGGAKVTEDQQRPAQEEPRDDVSHLDLRVGRVITAVKFSDTDSLYMKHVDVGEAFFRTAVTDMPPHIPLDEMQNRMVVVLCNLKPVSTRGVESQALLLCARSPDKMEILDPPSGAAPGDRVIFLEFPGEPDTELKATVWEQIQKDLRTNSQCVATYRGAAFEVEGKGVCTVQTLSDGEIK